MTTLLNNRNNGFSKTQPTMTNDINEPSSPTCSVFSSLSWIAEKPVSEVKHVLKIAFDSLAEKERDLKLAAEVGKTLLENNTLLEQKYHTLQNEFNIQCQQSSKHYQQKLQTNEHVITNLENQNAELLKKYEATLESKEKISLQNTSLQQKLTTQVNELYQSLDLAYEKIQEHEEYRQNYIKKLNDIAKEDSYSNELTHSMDVMTDNHYSQISNKMEHMLSQNQQLLKAKESIEFQVQDAVAQLKKLQAQFSQVQQSKEQFNLLENKFQHQESHIHQLTSLIEEYRLNLLSDCQYKKLPSLIAGNSSHASSDDEEESDGFDTLPQHIKGNSLFSELQLAFHNNSNGNDKNELGRHYSHSLKQDEMMVVSFDQKSLKRRPKNDKSSKNKMSCIYPGLKVDDSLISPMAAYHNKVSSITRNIPKPKSLLNRIVQIPFNSMYIIWRFIRFFIVIQLAMVIHFFTRK